LLEPLLGHRSLETPGGRFRLSQIVSAACSPCSHPKRTLRSGRARTNVSPVNAFILLSPSAPPLQLATPLTQHLARHGVIARARRTQHGHANDPALRESAVITARQATESNSPPAAAAPAAASMNAARRDSISSAAAPGSPTSSASSSRWTSASSLPSSHLNISPPLASLHLGSPTASGSPVSAAVSYASSSNGLWPAPQPSRGYYDPIRDTRRGSAESDSDGDDSDDR